MFRSLKKCMLIRFQLISKKLVSYTILSAFELIIFFSFAAPLAGPYDSGVCYSMYYAGLCFVPEPVMV